MRAMDPKVGLFRQLAWMPKAPDRRLVRLAPLVDDFSVAEGTVLVRQGDWDRQAFLIVDGRAEVLVDGEPIASVGAGAFVGEMAMLDGEARTATVRALTPLRVLVLGAGSFSAFLDQPGVARAMAAQLSERLRAAEASPPATQP